MGPEGATQETQEKEYDFEEGAKQPFTPEQAKELLGDAIGAKDGQVHKFLQAELMKKLKDGSDEDMKVFGQAAAELSQEAGESGEAAERLQEWSAAMAKVEEERRGGAA